MNHLEQIAVNAAPWLSTSDSVDVITQAREAGIQREILHRNESLFKQDTHRCSRVCAAPWVANLSGTAALPAISNGNLMPVRLLYVLGFFRSVSVFITDYGNQAYQAAFSSFFFLMRLAEACTVCGHEALCRFFFSCFEITCW